MACSLASSFAGASMRAAVAPRRTPAVQRGTLVVRAVQDLQGTVVSTSMNKSVVVAVERLAKHPEYAKRVRITKKYIAHVAAALCSLGDYVRLEGCRPLS